MWPRFDRAEQARRATSMGNGSFGLTRIAPLLAGSAVCLAFFASPPFASPVLASSVDRECRAGAPVFRGAHNWNDRRLELGRLTQWQSFRDSVPWRLTANGIVTGRGPVQVSPRERYRLESVPAAWRKYGNLIRAASRRYRVPAELFLAIIVNESALKPRAFQTYRGYISDKETPDRVSVGLGAILISTARYLLRDPSIDRAWLENPANNIRTIGKYLDWQYRLTGFDPPKVAAAYNAGGLHPENGRKNRWKMRNHPLGHSVYIDLFVAVLDEAIRYLARHPSRPRESFAALFAKDSIVATCVRGPGHEYRGPVGQAVAHQPLAHEIASEAAPAGGRTGRGVGAVGGSGTFPGGFPGDFLARLSRHQQARIALQSRISGRVPDDPAFRVAPKGRRVR